MENLVEAFERLGWAVISGIVPFVEPVIVEEALVAKAVPDPRGRYDWKAEASIPRLLAEKAARLRAA